MTQKTLFSCEHVTIEAYTTHDLERFSGVNIRIGSKMINITPFQREGERPTLSISEHG